jgi:hypothetical protein
MMILAAFFITLAGLTVFILLTVGFRRHPTLGVLFVAGSLLTIWEFPNPPPLAAPFGLQIYLNDIMSSAMLIAALLNYRVLAGRLGRSVFAWGALGVAIAFSLARGVIEFGLAQSFNEARAVLWVYFAVSWALSVDWSRLNRRRMLMTLGWALTAVAVFHGALYGVGNSASFVAVGDVAQTGRILLGSPALALALCAVTLLLSSDRRPSFVQFSGLLFGAVAIMSQHRSVWVAAIVGLAALMLFNRGLSSRLRAWGLSFLAGIVFLMLIASGLLNELLDDLTSSATDSRTLDARTTSWAQLMQQFFDEGPFAVLFGLPFGWGFTRTEPNGLTQTYSAHNWYVLLLLRVGVIGLIAWCVVVVRGILLSRRHGSTGFFALVAFPAFSFFYSDPWQIAPWLGLAFSSLGERSSAESPPRKTTPPVLARGGWLQGPRRPKPGKSD